jgi:hypothetical protein
LVQSGGRDLQVDLRELNEFNFARFDANLDQRVAGLEARLEAVEARLEARMARFEARIMRWMFLFWVGQAATTVGLVFGVVRLIGH